MTPGSEIVIWQVFCAYTNLSCFRPSGQGLPIALTATPASPWPGGIHGTQTGRPARGIPCPRQAVLPFRVAGGEPRLTCLREDPATWILPG